MDQAALVMDHPLHEMVAVASYHEGLLDQLQVAAYDAGSETAAVVEVDEVASAPSEIDALAVEVQIPAEGVAAAVAVKTLDFLAV